MTVVVSPGTAFVVLFLLGLTVSLAIMVAARVERVAVQPPGDRTLLRAGVLAVVVPLLAVGVLLMAHPREPLQVLVLVYANGVAVDYTVGVGAWTVAWLAFLFGPPTVAYVYLTAAYPERAAQYFAAVGVYLVVLVGLFLYGLYFQTDYEPLYLGDPARSIRADDWIHALFQVPFGVAAYTIGEAGYYRDRRLLSWLLVLWSPVALQGGFLVWYVSTSVL